MLKTRFRKKIDMRLFYIKPTIYKILYFIRNYELCKIIPILNTFSQIILNFKTNSILFIILHNFYLLDTLH